MRANLDTWLKSPPPNPTISHPPHYTFGKIEPIDVIEDWQLGFHLGNALKYLGRAGRKGNKTEDLEKCIWYIQREITNLKKTK